MAVLNNPKTRYKINNFKKMLSPYSKAFRQIICWQSPGTTTVTEVKLHYFRGRGSTTVVAVKKQVQLKNLRIAKFIQKWKKKFLRPLPWKQRNFTSITVVLPRLYQQMIWRIIFFYFLKELLKIFRILQHCVYL